MRIHDFIIDAGCYIYVAGGISGSFQDPKQGVQRLFLDGSVDNSYNPVTFSSLSSEEIFDIELQPDGKLLAGGNFDNIKPNNRDIRGLMRLNADGTLDDSFNPDVFPNSPEGVDIELSSTSMGYVNSIKYEEANERLIVAGKFDSYNGIRKLPLIAVHASSGVPATFAIPDANFEQALIDANLDTDGIQNNEMKILDALCVKNLDLDNKSISDLTGIANFSNLETLSAVNNQLTSVDLSSNLSLVEVNINQNAVSTIDVSSLTALESLKVADNDLINLDVSQNSILNDLDCSNNQLESLNIQNENNSNFTSFDAQNNPDLSCIQVDDVSFSNDNFTNIDPQMFFSNDCSSIVNIPDPNFEQVLIDEGIDSDGTLNGLMAQSDALGVIDLDVSSEKYY